MDETKEGGKREVMERSSSNDVGVRSSSWSWAELWSDAVAGGDEEGEKAEDVVSGTLCCSSRSFSVGGT